MGVGEEEIPLLFPRKSSVFKGGNLERKDEYVTAGEKQTERESQAEIGRLCQQ